MIAASIAAIKSNACRAFDCGASIGSNPYPVGSDAHRVWANAFAACYVMEVVA